MFSHFQYETIKNNWVAKEWKFSFFYKGVHCEGTYSGEGQVKWLHAPKEDIEQVETHVHDLMLYHEFEEHNPNSQ
ncbi:DUF5342 family protein [Geomicrobium sp. JSM 1781026]|uniref:DUF5342 family protein n=1 Tax=Geomicrobium sp. JSM 1781026 TaxID=3344580 RepID=UPI0035C1DCD1